MDPQRRKLLGALAAVGTASLAGSVAQGAEAKPLTTASLAKSLLTLADKAELQGMRREAQAIYAAVKVVMDGSPATLRERKGGSDAKS